MFPSFSSENNNKKYNHLICNKTIGISNNKFYQFNQMRNEYFTNQINNIPLETDFCLNDNGKTRLLDNKSNDKNTNKNNKKFKFLNPNKRCDSSTSLKIREMDTLNSDNCFEEIFQETNKIYIELNDNFVKLQKEQERRIVPKFDDEENNQIDKNIKKLISTMTKSIKKSEENIKKLSNTASKNNNEQIIKENMKINLAEKIRDFTFKFRVNEEKFIKRFNELPDEIKLDNDELNNNSNNNNNINFFQDQIDNKELRIRDEQITSMLTSITELSVIFKDMQSIVQHQGTILDRIDYNIDTALTNTEEANKHLVKANEHIKNNCIRNAILSLIITNFILALLLVFKFL